VVAVDPMGACTSSRRAAAAKQQQQGKPPSKKKKKSKSKVYSAYASMDSISAEVSNLSHIPPGMYVCMYIYCCHVLCVHKYI
jgi:hypothetical protein